MELQDIVLLLVSVVVGMLAYFFQRLTGDIKELEDKMNFCQANLPTKYIMKEDYKDDINEIKGSLRDIFGVLRKHDLEGHGGYIDK